MYQIPKDLPLQKKSIKDNVMSARVEIKQLKLELGGLIKKFLSSDMSGKISK